MRGGLAQDPGSHEDPTEDGPFVSFTDLFIGILFLFLILVAALMLMHQEGVAAAKLEARIDAEPRVEVSEASRVREDLKRLQAKLDAAARSDAERPPFRLAMVYNVYQAPPLSNEWTFSRTVQVFRSPDNRCMLNVILRNNYSMAWKPPLEPSDIPNAKSPEINGLGTPCRISASGEYWKTGSETGGVNRSSETLYRGMSVLHKADGDERVQIVYDVLAVYDDYFR